MSIMMRGGATIPVCTLFLFGLLAVATPVRAEDKPAAWTDPPVRGAAAPEASDRGKSEESPASAPASERAEGSNMTKGAKARSAASQDDEPKSSADRKRDRPARSARLGQDRVHRSAARMRAEPEQSVALRKVVARSAKAERSIEASSVRPVVAAQAKAASRVALNRSPSRQMSRRDVLAERYGRWPVKRFDEDFAMGGDRSIYRGGGYGPYRAVRGGDPFDDDRADRIASARAAGYLVMRSRTYTYSDGARFQSVRPYFPDDPNGFE